MINIYIVGAGGAAKEIYHLINSINIETPTYIVKGFVDISKADTLNVAGKEFEIINEKSFLSNFSEKVHVVFAIADTKRLKQIVSEYISHENFIFPNLIHPKVHIDDSVKMSKANIISEACVFTVDISIGSYNYFNRGVHVGHDCNIESYNVINPCAVISGSVKIDDEVFIGTNATVLQNLNIGKKATIGAGAVVVKDVKGNTLVVGVPAKEIA
ncbi:NeuD/PglB/VioB family sugar acetyltransferase [Patiriisocius marinus]|uniref:NeuD/PglB/VioB family sugar acetyltransferase n=1 Tax=Patiriisocius marinus TaxID=1397112 RepID=UPI00232D9B27|nr:NeuD/PglB/VioB family sugar acetyltransferase [Patiriisocius marinus]